MGRSRSRDNMPIDVIISPEMEVARAISRRLQIPGAFESISLVEGKVRMMGVRCNADCPVINTPLRQLTGLFPDLNIVVVAISRDGQGIVPSAAEQLLEGDEVYFVADAAHVSRAMTVFGHEERAARRVIIAGGGHIGAFLGEIIENEHKGVSARIIESNADRAHQVADWLEGTVVINGDVIDPEILEEAGVNEKARRSSPSPMTTKRIYWPRCWRNGLALKGRSHLSIMPLIPPWLRP